jgi:hypothetical protein
MLWLYCMESMMPLTFDRQIGFIHFMCKFKNNGECSRASHESRLHEAQTPLLKTASTTTETQPLPFLSIVRRP